MNSKTQGIVPESVELIYRAVGNTHVFSSKGIRGLLNIGSCDREKAFHGAIPALNSHVAAAYGCEVAYKLDVSYEDFCKHVDTPDDFAGNFLYVTLENKARVGH